VEQDVNPISKRGVGFCFYVGAQFIAPKSKGVMNHAPTAGNIVRTYKVVSTVYPNLVWI
jgi:hypothetical protein